MAAIDDAKMAARRRIPPPCGCGMDMCNGTRRYSVKNLAGSHTSDAGLGLAMEEVLARHRSQIRDAFAAFIAPGGKDDKVLDLGAIGRSQPAERLHVKGRQGVDHQVTFHDVLLPAEREPHAGSDGMVSVLELPFADGEFDWVFCNRVLEFAGDRVQQHMLLKELNRVARRGLFVTASNRRHPLEFNTGLPLLHWLPEAHWKRCLGWMSKQDSRVNQQLNLLGADDLSKMTSMLSDYASFDIGHIRYLGIKAQFYLMIWK
jgi:hypothetical protein